MGLVTDSRFLIGIAVGAGVVLFLVPYLRGLSAQRSGS
jgi:hypothetical protein